jgi:hypothetical protein
MMSRLVDEVTVADVTSGYYIKEGRVYRRANLNSKNKAHHIDVDISNQKSTKLHLGDGMFVNIQLHRLKYILLNRKLPPEGYYVILDDDNQPVAISKRVMALLNNRKFSGVSLNSNRSGYTAAVTPLEGKTYTKTFKDRIEAERWSKLENYINLSSRFKELNIYYKYFPSKPKLS